ncbi:uncharacterized protein J4E84_004552 [Alternaria hordeiaustralica]|uniref:uncharacterized protein n=1 Tax=Alternaria hordeiaustralica TaxID=1187925 RepID=UPI0020C3B873|nr:uncharacterized protein J4E84_004552 [Alternaria hordeiaustralica]KAI4688622.1 hypothetical protein J4E84_004552 [Alternaria hordeiaustralica]
MESKGFFDFEEDEHGELMEATEAGRVIDINLKGTMNTLRMAIHSMKSNPPDADGARGSIVLIASTSGYFGGTGVVSYISSKHGVVGLSRASQSVARQLGVRVNVVAPFFTPTHITSGYSEKWKESGLPANTTEDVAIAIVSTSVDPARQDIDGRVLPYLRSSVEATEALDLTDDENEFPPAIEEMRHSLKAMAPILFHTQKLKITYKHAWLTVTDPVLIWIRTQVCDPVEELLLQKIAIAEAQNSDAKLCRYYRSGESPESEKEYVGTWPEREAVGIPLSDRGFGRTSIKLLIK